MLKVVTANEMQRIDHVTIKKYGLSGLVLMERAGLSVVEKINKLFIQDTDKRKIIVLCGGGNNGGDGFVIARLLNEQGEDVEVYLTVSARSLKGDAKINYDAAKKFGVKIYPMPKFLRSRPLNTIIVDALLGTGLSKEVRPLLSRVINKVNRMTLVVSVDIPSGISSDTGLVMGCAVKAGQTVTFGLPKRGHLLYPGAEHTGRLFVEDIGFPGKLLESAKKGVYMFQRNDALEMLPERPDYSHKGTYGHVLLVAGSKGKTGAALMAARACLRTGAGLVTIGVPETLVNTFQSRVTEEMILPLPDRGDGTFSYSAADTIIDFMKKSGTVMAIGPGMSVDNEISRLVASLITGLEKPVVIDADGLNAIAGKTGILKKSRAPIILTPHPGEMKRLLRSKQEVEVDRIGTAVSFAKRTGTYLLLKGVPTVVATPVGGVFLNTTGNPGMATAGTGDVLTGMIAALLAQKLTAGHASILGAYLHGLAGDMAAVKKGGRSLTASDIIKAIPVALRSISD
ncbi:MAG TPA: NAD(P)H-hydrate dehydratase [Nitrospirae bacterium]|nr:NAD(P)H-hydrate dehydratase [Nitrospirota bacterium]